jgi:YD repeat-containing protein
MTSNPIMVCRTGINLLPVFTVLVMLLVLPVEITAQQADPFKVNLIPPSPEAAALARYADIPVSLYSGTPQISIPLYELKEREFSLPIAASYHAGGNKVGAEASRAGLGWSLNAGGAITRTVRSWPDEFTSHGFLHQAQVHEPGDFALDVPATDRYPLYDAMANNCLDVEPDVFYFNFAEYSGRFMFRWDGQIEISSPNSLKIVPLGLNPGASDFIHGFDITTDDGTVFRFFDVTETSQPTANSPSLGCDLPLQNTPIVSTWYLTEIFSAKSAGLTWIRFEYESYTQIVESWSMETRTHNWALGPATPERKMTSTLVSGKQLRRIITSSGQTTVEFLNGAQRTDLGGTSYMLGTVLVRNNLNKVIKDWRFTHDYSTGRLTLKKITEMSATSSIPPYEFRYYNGELPAATSFHQDHWGFYNSNNYSGVATMIPATKAFPVGSTSLVNLQGASRQPHAGRVLTGMLREIVYPTGGRDVMEFEPHDYSFMQNSELIKDIVQVHYVGTVSAPDWNTPAGATHTDQEDFTVTTPTRLVIDASATFGYVGPGGGNLAGVTLTVKNTASGDVLFYRAPAGTPSQGPNGEIEPAYVYINDSIAVSPGQYSLIVTGRKPVGIGLGMNSIAASLKWSEKIGTTTEIRQGGGVRIKRMTRSFGNGNPAKVTCYVYRTVENGTEKSSGSLLETAFRYEEWLNYKEGLNQNTVPKFFRFSQNRCALGTTQGSHVGYGSVTVLQGDNGENGKTVYTYTSPRQVPDYHALEIPYPPAWSYDYQRGLLLQQEDYNNSGTLLKRISNQYESHNDSFDESVIGIKVGFVIPGDGPFGPSLIDRYGVAFYRNFLGYTRLKATSEKRFFPGTPQDVFETTQKFTYNEDDGHRQLVLTSTTNSENDTIYTRLRYPQDYPAGNSALDLLKTQHRLSEVVEKLSWKRTGSQLFLLSAIKTAFTTLSNARVLPAVVSGARISAPILTTNPQATAQGLYEERLQYLRYDGYNNLTEHAPKDGQRTAYTWGGTGNLLLSKTDNARADQVFHTSFEEDALADGSFQKTGRKSKALSGAAYAIPAAALPASAGHYVLSYWVRETTSWAYREKDIPNYQPGNSIITDVVNGYIDEVRLHPQASLMTTFTYEPLVGITSITDPNHVTLYFEYDDFNRLKCKRDQDYNILECYDYRYQEEIQYSTNEN